MSDPIEKIAETLAKRRNKGWRIEKLAILFDYARKGLFGERYEFLHPVVDCVFRPNRIVRIVEYAQMNITIRIPEEAVADLEEILGLKGLIMFKTDYGYRIEYIPALIVKQPWKK